MAGNIKGITIEINGNTTKFDKAIRDSNKEVNSLNKELRNIDSSLKFNPGNVELLSQKQELLKQKTQAAKEKLDALKAAQADVEKQFANGEIDQGQYNKFKQEVIKAESQVQNFNKQLQETQKELKGLQGFQGAMNKIGDGFQKAGDKMAKIGGEMSKKVTAPIVAIGTAAGVAWKGIDDALDTIATKTGATGDAIKEFEKNLDNVFTSIPVDSAQQVGDAIGELNTQFGFTGETLEQASTQMIQFAKINGTDITNSTIAAKQAMSQFGASAEELPGFLDAVTAAAQQTGQSTDSIFEAVRKGAPQLKAMGLGLNDSAIVMAKFQQAGLDSSTAISMLTRAQTNFAKDGKTLKEGMAEFFKTVEQGGDSVDVINQATAIFGKNGSDMVNAIKEGIVSLDDFTASGEDFAGTVEETFNATQDPVDQFRLAMQNLQKIGKDIFDSIQEVAAPMLETLVEKLVEKLRDLSDWWENLSPQTKETIVKVGLIVAAIGPLLMILGKVTKGVGLVIKALGALTSPVGLVVAAVAIAVVAIIKHWDKIKEAWEATKKFVVDVWNSLKEEAEKIWTAIKEFFEKTWEAIKKTVETVWNGIKDFFKNTWDGLKSTAENIWNGVKDFFSNTWSAIKSTAENTWGSIKGFFEDTWGKLKSTAETIWGGVKTAIIDPISEAATTVWDKGKEMADNFIKSVKDLPEKIGNTFKNVYESVRNWMDKAINKVKEFFGFKSKAEKESSGSGGGSRGNYTPTTPRGGATPARSYRSALDVTGVSWYDKGGIFKSPQVIGIAEKRPEFVGALDDLRKIVREETGKGYSINISRLEVREEADIDKIAKKLYELQRREQRGRALC